MMAKTYQIQMGFDLNSAILTGSNPDQALYPLQNAVADVTARSTPAWFTRFEAGDAVQFFFFNITSLQNPSPSLHIADPVVEVSFADPDSGDGLWPFSSPSELDQWRLFALGKEVSSVYSPGGELYPAFSLKGVSAGSNVENFVFAEPEPGEQYCFCKLSMKLTGRRAESSEILNFVFDPEMIISRGGG